MTFDTNYINKNQYCMSNLHFFLLGKHKLLRLISLTVNMDIDIFVEYPHKQAFPLSGPPSS